MRAFGIDTSPNSATSYTRQPHHDFGMVIVSDGTWVRPGADELMVSVRENKIALGCHYLRSDYSWRDQVDAYFAGIDGHVVDGHVVDFEKINNLPSYEFAKGCQYWVDAVRTTTGQRTLVYTGSSVYQEWMFPYGVTFLADDPEKYPLMIAQYPYTYWNPVLENVPIDLSWQPRLPAGITSWKSWQYSADGNGQADANGIEGNDDVDLQVFDGTVAEMLAYFGRYDLPFSDIAGHWAENQIVECHDDGLISGYPDGTFKPNNSMTRAEVCAIVARL